MCLEPRNNRDHWATLWIKGHTSAAMIQNPTGPNKDNRNSIYFLYQEISMGIIILYMSLDFTTAGVPTTIDRAIAREVV